MKSKFQPIVVGYDFATEQIDTTLFNDKIKRFKALETEIDKFIKIEDKNLFKGNLYELFINLFYDKNKLNFPPDVPLNVMLKMMEVNLNKIQSLIAEFNAIELDLDLNNLEKPTKDYSIYTENESQNKLAIYLNRILSGISEIKKMEKTVYPQNIVQGLNGLVVFNHESNALILNHFAILDKIR
jgi:hypothetical protein